YAELGKKNNFPELERCPSCRGVVRLKRHGFYWRNAIEGEQEYRIPICRLKCPSCEKTTSLLPSFLIPYFQHTLGHVVVDIHKGLTESVDQYRQRIQFYRRRYFQQLKQVEMFFRAEGFRGRLPGEPKEKAIKLLEMIRAFGEATFVRRSTGHFTTNFMAL
ncbi:DUF6431 domain-containing protein, partial [Dethiobacter alkaliphilus]|uniref:DUF6431 domain-containing protein n=1 Tax=Dethiobacter alkaliphilus TaxID=427926 RepID=UPI002227A502